MLEKPVAVTVFQRTGRPNFVAQWTDPISGKTKMRSTGHRVRRDAERWAVRLERDLNAGGDAGRRVTWETFVERVERDFLPAKRESTQAKYSTVLGIVERRLRPKRLAEINPEAIGRLTAELRKTENTEATIVSYLRHLKAMLTWAHRQGMLPAKVTIDMPKEEAAAKGRPLKPKEFVQMLRATWEVCGPERGGEWRRLLRGLWLSGLRLSEAIALTWDDPDGVRVRLDGPFPALFIPGRMQKGRKDTVTPLTPDFAAYLARTPPEARTGFVFSPHASRGGRVDHLRAGIVIGRIGAAAGVRVKGKKTATAHDLRRSFCFRWAQKILPQHLRSLARHTSVNTTLQFYAEADAAMTAEALAAAVAGR